MTAGYTLKRLERELYMLESSVRAMRKQVEDRMKVVIPPTIYKVLQRGQYLSTVTRSINFVAFANDILSFTPAVMLG